jgi:hypothetical protein
MTKLGNRTSAVEVTNISPHGVWMLVNDHELILRFEHFPWFRDASVAEICDVELASAHHLYWPSLDIDLSQESIEHPERFPLVSKGVRSGGQTESDTRRR